MLNTVERLGLTEGLCGSPNPEDERVLLFGISILYLIILDTSNHADSCVPNCLKACWQNRKLQK